MLLILQHKCSLKNYVNNIYIWSSTFNSFREEEWWLPVVVKSTLAATEVSHCFNFFYYNEEAHQTIIKEWQLNYRYVNINMTIKLLLIVSNLYSTFIGSGRRRVSLFVPSWSTLLPVPVSSFVSPVALVLRTGGGRIQKSFLSTNCYQKDDRFVNMS